MKNLKTTNWPGMILLAALLLVPGGRPTAQEAARPDRPGTIELERCRIKLIDRVTLASDRVGVLEFVEPREGVEVAAGQRVAGLRDDVAEARLAVAQKQAENDIEVRFAKKAAEVAKTEHRQAVLANEKFEKSRPGSSTTKVFPEIEVEKLKLAAERAVLQIEQAQHNLEVNQIKQGEAEAELKTYQIEAPFDGVVRRVFKFRGEAVRQGDPIMELVNTDRLRVEGHVPLKDIFDVHEGAPVEVRIEIPDADLPVEDETFEGKIVFIDLEADRVTREILVWAEVENRGNLLRAGWMARMTILPQPTGKTGAVSQK